MIKCHLPINKIVNSKRDLFATNAFDGGLDEVANDQLAVVHGAAVDQHLAHRDDGHAVEEVEFLDADLFEDLADVEQAVGIFSFDGLELLLSLLLLLLGLLFCHRFFLLLGNLHM